MAAAPVLHLFLSTDDITSDGLSAELSLGYNKPILRKQLIYAGLKRCDGVEIHKVDQYPQTLNGAAIVHEPGFTHYLNTAFDLWTAAWEKKTADQFFAGNSDRDGGDPRTFSAPQVCPRHDGLQRPGSSVFSQACYYSQDRLTPLTKYVAPALRRDLAVTESAVRHVTSAHEAGDKACVAYALTTHPGHHSTASTYGGYCYINQSAVAARLLQQSFGKTAILDIDYHAGNGSESIFWDDPTVLVISIHSDPSYDYPYNQGFVDQIGGEKAEGTIVNYPMAPNSTYAEYLPVLEKAIKQIVAFGAKSLVVSMGLDTLANDPEASPLGGLKLQVPEYAGLGAKIRELKLPTVFVQEGGYYLQDVPLAAANTVLGRPQYQHSLPGATPDQNHPLLKAQS